MQCLPRERAQRIGEIHVNDSRPARFTVDGITDNWPSISSKMCTNLMRSTSDEAAAKKRKSGFRRRDFREPLEPGHAVGAVRRRRDHPAAIVRITTQTQ